jgi:hypothetical protein
MQNDKDEKYARALELMQYEIQRLWIIFGTYLLAQTVLLGGLISAFKDSHPLVVYGGALIGFVLVVPWWTSFEYCRIFYLLRIAQAKVYEDENGLLKIGQLLHDGKPIPDFKSADDIPPGEPNGNDKSTASPRLPYFVRLLKPRWGARIFMASFAAAYLAIACLNASWDRTVQPDPQPTTPSQPAISGP